MISKVFNPSQIVEIYKSNKHTELEFRYSVGKNPNLIKDFLIIHQKEYSSICDIEQTSNLIYEDDVKKPKFIITKNYSDESISYTLKQKIIDVNYGFVKISLSSEEKAQDFNKPKNQDYFIRIKNRLTIPYENIGRFDITQIVTINDQQKSNRNAIKMIQANLFKPINANGKKSEIYKQFIANFDNPAITSIEMEFEFNNNGDIDEKYLKSDFALEIVGEEIATKLSQQKILTKIAKLAGIDKSKAKTIKTLTNNAVSITKNDYNNIYPPIGWYVTPKADGYTGILILGLKEKNYLLTKNDIFLLKCEKQQFDQLSVFVGEVLENRFLCFDCLINKGANITNLAFSDRLIEFSQFLEEPIELICDNKKFVAEVKHHKYITDDLQVSFREVLDMSLDYEIDGYILVSPDKSYFSTDNYKIKDHHTIDFLVLEAPKFMKKNSLYLGQNVFLLFCSITPSQLEKTMIKKIEGYSKLFPRLNNNGNQIPIQFAPSDDPYAYIWHPNDEMANKLRKKAEKSKIICELEYLPDKKDWQFIKFRDDRINEPNYYGNNLLKTSEIEWLITKYPLKLQEMHLPMSAYFEKSKSDLYFAQTSAIRFSISKIFENITVSVKSKSVIDLACGKGQDLNKYYNLGYEKAIFVDGDALALCELLVRRYTKILDRKKNYKMNINILHRDLTLDADETYQLFKPLLDVQEFGLIVCNLAIHYLIETPDLIKNFIKLIRQLSTTGTYFMYTCFSGQAVLDLLNGQNEWKYVQNDRLKYNIIKKFSTTKLEEHSQTIEVKMPFSDKYYTENLVNLKSLNEYFVKFGFNLIVCESFSNFMPKFKTENPSVYNMLTEEDLQYIGLFHYTILSKK